MKHLLWPVLVATLLSGCASAVSPVTGSLYTNVKAPLLVTDSTEKPTKVGRATMRSILGIYAVVFPVTIYNRHTFKRQQPQNLMGVMSDFTVIVYGN